MKRLYIGYNEAIKLDKMSMESWNSKGKIIKSLKRYEEVFNYLFIESGRLC